MSDTPIRNLANLQRSASSSRVLNLLAVHQRRQGEADYLSAPFFRDTVLNRSILLKHRLRGDERRLFVDGRTTATKLIIPIDKSDLRLGGRSVFVGQYNYDAMMGSTVGQDWIESQDRQTLELLDQIPSLDPFLLREHLRRHSRAPARCYFEVSEADAGRMFEFVQAEVQRLVALCYAEAQAAGEAGRGYAQRLVRKILSETVDADTDPLRQTLKLERREYEEGVFCWKGFLYYKWALADAMPAAQNVARAISQARTHGRATADTQAYLERARGGLGASILAVCGRARRSLSVYDEAFARLVDGEPAAFRDFLLSAPAMFTELGERLGAVSHVVSYWNYRFPGGRPPPTPADDLKDIFQDFETRLGVAARDVRALRAA